MNELERTNLLGSIFDSSLDAIIITDEIGYITEVNKAFLELLGYKKEEVIGKHTAEFSPMKEGTYECTTGELIQIDKKFSDDIQSTMRTFMEGENLQNVMGYQLRKDGKIVPVEDNMVFLLDDKGERTRAFAVIRDITERQKIEKELSKTKDYLENIFMTSVDGVIIGDSEGKIATVNKAVEEIFDCSGDQLVGKHTAEMGFVKGKDKMSGKELIEQLLREGTITGVERTLEKADGSSVVIEMNIALLKDDEGNMTGSVASIRDITDRKQAEWELAETRDYLENIIESSLDGIVVSDSMGYIVRANNAFLNMLGYRKKEIIGKHIIELSPLEEGNYDSTTGELIHINDNYFKSMRTAMASFLHDGKVINRKSFYLTKDNKLFPAEDSLVFLFDTRGDQIGAVGVIRDITERKKAEEALLESEEKYKGLVNNIGIGVSLISPNMEILALNNQMQQWFPETDVSKKPICYKTFNNPPREEVCSYCPTFKTLKDGQVHESITDTPQGDKTIHYRIISSSLKDNEGKITSAIEMVEDITEQKAAQEKLQESEEKYHNLIEHANDAIVSVNSAGRIIGFNKKAEEMFGFSHEEVMGKSSYLFIPHQDQNFYEDALKHFAKTGTELDRSGNILEGQAVRKDGVKLEIEYSYFTINVRGEFIATAILRDISKRKEEEKKLINYQEKLKSLTSELLSSEQKERQYFADFLHDEIGQQLFATRLQMEQLKGSLSSAENRDTLDNALNNLYQVMNQTRTLTTELSSPILNQLGLEKALEWLAEQTHKKYDILVTFANDKQEKPLDDNMKLLLYQAISELLTNVAKHAQVKNASVSIKKDNTDVRICVEDKGIGFNPQDKNYSEAKIEGFGLFRIKERVESLGGQLEIESQPNRGTKVTLVAPLSSGVENP